MVDGGGRGGAYKTQTTGGLGFPFVAVIMREGIGVRDRDGNVEVYDIC